MKINSIKFKICVLYVGVLGLILVVYRGLLYFNLYHALYKDSDAQLTTKAKEVHKTIQAYVAAYKEEKRIITFAARRIIRAEGKYSEREKIKELEAVWFRKRVNLGLNEDYINFLTTNGSTIVSSPNIDRDMARFFEQYAKKPGGQQSFDNVVYQGHLNIRIITMPVLFEGLGRYFIQVGTSTDPIVYILRERFSSSALSIPPILFIAVMISYLFVWRILRPVEQIAKTANAISHENLNARVNLANVDEEMKYLAESFNNMITRLEESFAYVAQFSSYVAHELRTPLTIIRGETEVALKTNPSLEECTAVMQSNLQEVDKMLSIIEHLFLLTEINYRKEVFNLAPLDLTEFLKDIYAKTTLLASRKEIIVTFSLPQDQITVMSNPMELRRLLFNIVDNAIKFTLQGGAIDISVTREHQQVSIAVRDTGIGITEEDIPKIFDKFFRSAAKDENRKPGSGLGLSIAQSIANIHQGRIEVKSTIGKGSTFTVILPTL